MKTFNYGVAAALCFCMALVTACSENERDQAPPLTQQINKIETSYYKGAPKVETLSTDKKLEEVAPDWYVQRIQRDVDGKIDALMQDRTRTTVAKTLFAGYDVGVIPATDVCPSWSERISIFMDCEDRDAFTRAINCPNPPCLGAWSIDTSHNLRMIFCRVDGRSFHRIGGGSYGILKLGVNNLPDSKLLVRYFDNEDTFNGNTRSEDIAPNISTQNTLLQFHVFESSGVLNTFLPSFSFPYKVLRGDTHFNTSVAIDDEDSGNANYATYDGAQYANTLTWLEGGKNTIIAMQ